MSRGLLDIYGAPHKTVVVHIYARQVVISKLIRRTFLIFILIRKLA